jgi:alpha-beta hydrolase superfamily lysophospholipase
MPSLLDDPVFSANAFFPRKDAGPPPRGAIDARLPVANDVTLHARIHPSADASPELAWLVLFHGNGEVVSDYDAFAPHFAEAGARLAVVDYRGYGRSEGTPDLRTTVSDAPKALDAIWPLLAEGAPNLPMVVMGRSLGSMCAAELMRSSPRPVSGFVFESGFTDILAFARRRGATFETLDEADMAILCPLRKLAGSKVPLLVLHGETDSLISANEARAAFAASGAEDKELVLVPGRGHNDVSFHPTYWNKMAAFVARMKR